MSLAQVQAGGYTQSGKLLFLLHTSTCHALSFDSLVWPGMPVFACLHFAFRTQKLVA